MSWWDDNQPQGPNPSGKLPLGTGDHYPDMRNVGAGDGLGALQPGSPIDMVPGDLGGGGPNTGGDGPKYPIDMIPGPLGGGGGPNGGFGGAPSPYQSTPWTGGPVPVYHGAGPAPVYAPYGGAVPTYQGPGAAPTFSAPTGIDEQNDPGYQARMAAGNQALNRGFAASGNLLSGGTLKALARYNQDYASNEFQNVYNRAQGDFSAQNQTFQNNQTSGLNTFGAQNQTYGQNVANAQNAFGAANTTYGNNQSAAGAQFGAENTNYQNRYATYLGDNARTLSDYTTNLNAQRNSQNDYWSRLLGLSGQGLSAAGQGQGA